VIRPQNSAVAGVEQADVDPYRWPDPMKRALNGIADALTGEIAKGVVRSLVSWFRKCEISAVSKGCVNTGPNPAFERDILIAAAVAGERNYGEDRRTRWRGNPAFVGAKSCQPVADARNGDNPVRSSISVAQQLAQR
jgi:hypothetical protein